MKVLILLFLCLGLVAFADDFKTITGKEYKNATVSRVEPDGIVLTSKAGISKVYFAELPKDVQERFGYDPQKAGGRRRRHRKRPINIGQNKQVGTTRFERSKPATTSFKDKRTTCFSVLVRRNNLDLRTGPVRNCSTVQTRNDPNYPSSKAT